MARKILRIGIISRKDYKARSIAIARGDYKAAKGEPKIWFESLQSLHLTLMGIKGLRKSSSETGY